MLADRTPAVPSSSPETHRRPAAARHPSPAEPRFALVTPSLNQGRFLRQAIESVLAQEYPNLDYLVVDGGSTDETLDVLRSFGERLRWISEPDGGQTDAIAKGFALTEGEILGWLNADDLLLPGALRRVAATFEGRPATALVYGRGRILDEEQGALAPFTGTEPFDLWRLVHYSDYILQPAAFFRRQAYDRVGGLDRDLSWSMDWDLWIRLASQFGVRYLPEELAVSRCWKGTKTATGGWKRWRELAGLAERHAGRFWTPATCLYALDTVHQRLRPRTTGGARALLDRGIDRLAVAVGRRVSHYADGWLGPRAELLVPRRWSHALLKLDVVRLPLRRRRLEIRLALDGEPIGRLPTTAPGRLTEIFRVPQEGESPFCRLEIRSNFSFRVAGDPRRLAVRFAGIQCAS